MNRTRPFIALVFSLTALVRLEAQASLVDLSPREQARRQTFAAVHRADAAEVQSSYYGRIGDHEVRVFAFGSLVRGTGPHGDLRLDFFGSMVTGTSGDHNIALHSFGSSVSGDGARGRVHLSVVGRSIYGYVGQDHVSVNIFGSSASGFIGTEHFTLHGFDNLNPAGVAALIGAL